MNLGQGCPLALISGRMPHGCMHDMHLRPAHYTGQTTPQASITCACQGGYCDVWDGTGLVDTTYTAACMIMDRSMGDLAHSALAGVCVLSGMTHLQLGVGGIGLTTCSTLFLSAPHMIISGTTMRQCLSLLIGTQRNNACSVCSAHHTRPSWHTALQPWTCTGGTC